MKKFLSGLLAAAMSASLGVASAVPAAAAPMVAPSVPTASQDVQKVQEWRWRRNANRMNSDHMRYSLGERSFGDREWRRWRGDNWRGDWRGDRWRDARWRDRDYRYWRGHRGYRSWRRGYREFDGWWFPLAAFTAGAVIGSAIDQPRVIYRQSGGGSHTQWCYNRYRSYRAYDNTYQPYNGPRRQCYSPYS
jgi:hypothetical protein